MSDEFLVMYQESKSLPKDALQYVLKKEMEMVALFENILQSCVESGRTSHRTETNIELRHTTSSFKAKCGHFADGHCTKNIRLKKYIRNANRSNFQRNVVIGNCHRSGSALGRCLTIWRQIEIYKPKHHIRFVTASSSFRRA